MMHEARSPATQGTHTEASRTPNAQHPNLHVPHDLSKLVLIADCKTLKRPQPISTHEVVVALSSYE